MVKVESWCGRLYIQRMICVVVFFMLLGCIWMSLVLALSSGEVVIVVWKFCLVYIVMSFEWDWLYPWIGKRFVFWGPFVG